MSNTNQSTAWAVVNKHTGQLVTSRNNSVSFATRQAARQVRAERRNASSLRVVKVALEQLPART